MERVWRERRVAGEPGQQIREEVVNRVAVLTRELVEQQPRDRGDSRVRILQTPRHLRDVALHLHHVVEHEVRQHRHRVLTNARVRVVKGVAPLP